MKITGDIMRSLHRLVKKPPALLIGALMVGLFLSMGQPARSASIVGPSLLDVSGNYIGGTGGADGTSWTSSKTNFAYRLGGTAVGKNNRNTPNATGDTTGTLDPNLNLTTYFRMPPGGTLTISGTFTTVLTPTTFSPYGGQYIAVGLINRPWVNTAKLGYSSDMRTSNVGANGDSYLVFYKENLSSAPMVAMEDHNGGRATAADRRDMTTIGVGISSFLIQFQAGVDKNNAPVATGGRMRFALNNGPYGAWDNNSHDFVNQDATLLINAYTSLGYPIAVTFGAITTDQAPQANDDSYTVNEDGVLTITPAGVLANDSDPDGGLLTAALVSGPSNGMLTLNTDGSFSYTPNINYNGPDSFVYRAIDATGSADSATVAITVTPVNDPPSAVADNYTTAEDVPLNVPAAGILSNDSDVDIGDTLTAVLVSGPSNGNLTLNADGSFIYTPNPNFNGGDSFTYHARDISNAVSSNVTVTITVTPVNDAPSALGDSYTTVEETALNVPAAGVLSNDSDPEGSAITALLDTGPSNGLLTLNADGSFTYTPNPNFSGSDSFTYSARDTSGAQSTPTSVTINVTPVNDPPSATADSYTTAEDIPLNVPAAGVLSNDTDVDSGDSLTAVLVSGTSNGSLTLNADGSFSYTPNANFNGSDSFTYYARDTSNATSSTVTVTITITPVNDAPSALGDSYTTAEDTVLNVPATGVLTNDSDPEGSAITALLTSGPSNGMVTLNPDGSFSYTPNANFNGSDSFDYVARDPGGAQSPPTPVTINVTPVNDVPTASADSYNVNEDIVLNTPAPGVLGNDSNPDGGAFSAILISGPSNGNLILNADGSFSYTPNANFNGSDSFTYRARDAQADESATTTVTLTIAAVNDAPSFTKGADQTVNEDAGPQTVAGWATNLLPGPADETGQLLNFSLTTNNAALFSAAPAINPTGTLTYTPAPNANGNATVTVQLHDNGGIANNGVDTSAPQTFTITITPINDQPTAANDTASVGKNSVANRITVLANDSSAPDTGETLTITTVTQGTRGSVAIVSGGAALTYTPTPNYLGPDSFTYTISDGNGGTATATVNITVVELKVFLPLLTRGAPPAQPDLIGSFRLSPTLPTAGNPVTVTATITNQGTAPASQFWVDFYIDPTTPPTGPNQPWNSTCGATRCPYGIAWYVATPIAPGQRITLTSTATSYYVPNTIWPGFLVGGTHNLYLYVDSWNPTVASGAVQESNEANNRSQRTGLVVAGSSDPPQTWVPPGDLPDRPARP